MLITINYIGPELDYIESIFNIEFRYSVSPMIVYSVSDSNSPHDGYSTWLWVDGTLRAGSIEISPQFVGQQYLFLHEIGHALGLFEHRAGRLDETLMFEDGGGYKRTTLDKVTGYGSMDIVDLTGIWGTSRQWLGPVHGDARDNTVFGGTGVYDPYDGPEETKGMHGEDIIYGNGGNDTIYGGTSTADPEDGADTIYGGIGADIIYGNGGDDSIIGGPGNDTIYGGIGIDTIYGGEGIDVFFVDIRDVIPDYRSDVDILHFI